MAQLQSRWSSACLLPRAGEVGGCQVSPLTFPCPVFLGGKGGGTLDADRSRHTYSLLDWTLLTANMALTDDQTHSLLRPLFVLGTLGYNSTGAAAPQDWLAPLDKTHEPSTRELSFLQFRTSADICQCHHPVHGSALAAAGHGRVVIGRDNAVRISRFRPHAGRGL